MDLKIICTYSKIIMFSGQEKKKEVGSLLTSVNLKSFY